MRFKTFFVLIISLFLITTGTVAAKSIVVWGGDLTQSQKEQVKDLFISKGADLTDSGELIVTNRQEREALKGKVDPAAIGTRAISSVYIQVGAGRGVDVVTCNISLITPQMYRSSLVTGGVQRGKVIAAAPFSVSGTAALTGIFKAYEHLTGEELSREAKDAATEELVQSGQLGKEIGQEKAAKLMAKIKEQVIKQKPKTREQVEEIIRQVAQNMDLRLSAKQLADLSKLFLRIGKLPLSLSQVKQLLGNRSFWTRVGAWLSELGAILAGLWSKLLSMIR